MNAQESLDIITLHAHVVTLLLPTYILSHGKRKKTKTVTVNGDERTQHSDVTRTDMPLVSMQRGSVGTE